jgi:DNA-binding beta-propeller fold protein YncE
MFLLALDWKITDTGVWQPLRPQEVLIGDSGQVYVLNFDDAEIGHYAASGEKIGTIGRKGQGPGEFTYATGIFYEKGKIYVQDLLNQSISIFDDKGTYQHSVRIPLRGVVLRRVANGWIYGDWRNISPDDPSAKLYLGDDGLEEIKEVLTIPDRGFSEGSMVMSDGSKVVARYSPITKQPRLEVSPDGKTAYLTDLDKLLIKVIDVASGKVVREIKHDEPRLPFDTEWAEEKFQESRSPEDTNDWDKMFPEYFPIIRDFKVLPDGTLMINRWRGRPGEANYPIALDPLGQEVPVKFPWEVVQRMIGIRDGMVYLTMFEVGDEEGWVSRVALADAAQFVKDHPIDPDASSSRSISISN